jgi:hypothetical protein
MLKLSPPGVELVPSNLLFGDRLTLVDFVSHVALAVRSGTTGILIVYGQI